MLYASELGGGIPVVAMLSRLLLMNLYPVSDKFQLEYFKAGATSEYTIRLT